MPPLPTLPRRVIAATLAWTALVLVSPPAGAGGVAGAIKDLRGKKYGRFDLTAPQTEFLKKARDGATYKEDLYVTTSGDTVTVTFREWRAPEWKERNAHQLRMIYSSGQPVVAVAIMRETIKMASNALEWAEFAELEPFTLYGWSSSMGVLNETKYKDLLINLPGPDTVLAGNAHVRLIRVLAPAPWPAQVMGEVRTYASLIDRLNAALAKQDFRGTRDVLDGLERPRSADLTTVYDALAQHDPEGAWLPLQKRAEAANDWPARLALLREISLQYDRQKRLAGSEKRIKRNLQHPVDPEADKAQLARIARIALSAERTAGVPPVIREGIVARVVGDKPDSALVRDWASRYRPYIENFDEVAKEHPMIALLDPIGWSPLRRLGLRWRNEADGAGIRLRLAIGPIDRSGLETVAGERMVQVGAWVEATSQQIQNQQALEKSRQEQAGAGERLAEIEAELRAIDATPAGQELRGAPGEQVVWRYVDPGGRTTDVVVGESRQNVYRVGVAKDIKARAARKDELKKERARLQALRGTYLGRGNEVRDGKVWNPTGGWEKRPGYIMSGNARRRIEVTGEGPSHAVDQERRVYVAAERLDQLQEPELIRAIEKDFDGATAKSRYIGSGLSLDAELSEMLRAAIARRIDGDEAEGKVAKEEAAWARFLYGLGPPPSEELRDYILKTW